MPDIEIPHERITIGGRDDLLQYYANAKVEAGQPIAIASELIYFPRKGLIARIARWLHHRLPRKRLFLMGYDPGYWVTPYDNYLTRHDIDLSKPLGRVTAIHDDGTITMRWGDTDPENTPGAQ